MKTMNAVLVAIFMMILVCPAVGNSEETQGEKAISGYVSVVGKYDTNVDLSSDNIPEDAFEDDEVEDAFINEISALLFFSTTKTSRWHAEFELYCITDLHVEAFDDTWYLGRGNLYLGYEFGDNTISLLNEMKYFSEPDDTELDNFENAVSLVYKRILSRRWQGRIGYENTVHLFPESNFFNYYLNGGFLEIRNPWLPALSTYYSYNFQYYQGSYNASEKDPLSSPEAGYRHTGEIGFESFFAGKNTLIGYYAFQVDDSSGQGVEQIGDYRGEDENLEVDAEFNFAKHKGTILYSHRFNNRFSLSLYGEYIYKLFFERNEQALFMGKERTDQLLLSSIWVKAELFSGLYAKTRYLYRMNESSSDYEDFQDHIFSLGLEYRF